MFKAKNIKWYVFFEFIILIIFFGDVEAGKSTLYQMEYKSFVANADCLSSSIKDYEGDVAKYFIEAAQTGNYDSLEVLLNNVRQKKDSYYTHQLDVALIKAIEKGCARCVALLLKHGASVDGESGNGGPLFIAIKYKHFEIVKQLISAGADAHRPEWEIEPLKNRIGVAVFYLQPSALFPEFVPVESFKAAIEFGDEEIVRYLYRRISPFNFHLKSKYKKTAAYCADKIKSVEMARTLQQLGILFDDRMQTCSDSMLFGELKGGFLYAALKNGNEDLFKYLLDEVKVPAGLSEVLFLVQRADAIRLERLLAHQKKHYPGWFGGGDEGGLNKPFKAYGHPHDSSTVLEIGMWQGGTEVTRVLLKYGARMSSVDSDIIEAACRREPEIIQMLVENGADPTAGYFASLACKRYALTELFITLGAKWEKDVPETQLRLRGASYYGEVEGVRILLEAGVPADVPDEEGETALCCALNNGKDIDNSEVASLLCAAGADPQRVVDDKSLLRIAFETNQVNTAQVLAEAGATDPAMTDLHWAVLADEPHRVSELLPQNTVKQAIKDDLLAQAVFFGKAQIVELLLTAGADPLAPGMEKKGNSLLYTAVSKDFEAITLALLRHGAVSDGSEDVLEYAADKKEAEVVHLLMKYGATLHFREDGKLAEYTLHKIIKRFPAELPRVLMTAGLHPESNSWDREKLLRAYWWDKNDFDVLLGSYLKTGDPAMQTLITALYPQEKLREWLVYDLRSTLYGGKITIALRYLSLVPGMEDDSRLQNLNFRAWDVSQSEPEGFALLKQLNISLERHNARALLLGLLQNGKATEDLIGDFYDLYYKTLEEEDLSLIIKEALQTSRIEILKKAVRNPRAKFFITKVLDEVGGESEELLEFIRDDLHLTDHSFFRTVPDPLGQPGPRATGGPLKYDSSILFAALQKAKDRPKAVRTVTKFYPYSRDAELVFRWAVKRNDFGLIRALYQEGVMEKIVIENAIADYAGCRYLEILRQGVEEPLWTQEMFIAVAKGGGVNDRDILASMLAQGVDINRMDRFGQLALVNAASSSTEITAFLMENGARVDQYDGEGSSPMMAAVDAHRREIVALLVEGETAPSASDLKLAGAYCATTGDADTLRRIADLGCRRIDMPIEVPMEEKSKDKTKIYSALEYATNQGYSAVVKVMCDLMDISCDDRKNALKIALDKGYFYSAQTLSAGGCPGLK
ncbi:MAG: ankyrin repeat domain-containing protein [Desulforhopalus sp.]